jgi:hypothetical protein
MSGVLFSAPRFIPVNSSGRPYPAAKLYFYEAGTTTLATVYTNEALTVAGPNPMTANSAGMFSAVYLNPASGNYKAVLQTSAGVQLWSEDNIPGEVALSQSSVGAALYPETADEISAGVTPVNYAYPPLHLLRYGTNTTPGTTDLTSAFVNMLTVAHVSGGTCTLPAGVIGITSVAFTWTAAVTINIVGAGENATYLTKIGTTTTPVLDLNAEGIYDTYSVLANFSVVGRAKANHGIRCTLLARLETQNIKITGCDVGFESVGALILQHNNPDWNSNNIGYRSRKSGGYYANLIEFRNGGVRANTTFGFDIGDASGVHWYGTDIEQNGTASTATTGNVIIRATVDDEIGYSVISMQGGWCEASYGTNFKVEAASGLALSIRDTVMAGNEGGLVLSVGAIQSVVIQNLQAGSGGGSPDTVTLAASTSLIMGGVIHTIADTSTYQAHIGVTTNAGVINIVKGLNIGSTGLSLGLGYPLKMISGANGRAGTGVLVGGTLAVATTAVTENSLIFAFSQVDGGTPGWLRCASQTAGVGFTISSSSGTDTSTFAWMLVDEA